MRLILNGKLLSPDTAPLATFKVENKAFVHCVVSEQAPAAPTGHVGASPFFHAWVLCRQGSTASCPPNGEGLSGVSWH